MHSQLKDCQSYLFLCGFPHGCQLLSTKMFGGSHEIWRCCAGEGENDAESDVSELSAWDDESAAQQALDDDELSDWSEDDSDLITANVEQHAAAPSDGPRPGKEILCFQ